MTLNDLLNNRIIQEHTSSKDEVSDLRKLIKRDLQDASIKELSSDRRFATAYNAALQLSKMAIACAGYRVRVGVGHHQKTFEAVKSAIATTNIENLADYFDLCRRKRNDIEYDAAEIVTDSEAEELVKKTKEFECLVGTYPSDNYPQLS